VPTQQFLGFPTKRYSSLLNVTTGWLYCSRELNMELVVYIVLGLLAAKPGTTLPHIHAQILYTSGFIYSGAIDISLSNFILYFDVHVDGSWVRTLTHVWDDCPHALFMSGRPVGQV
jgi:hypothetical protein